MVCVGGVVIGLMGSGGLVSDGGLRGWLGLLLEGGSGGMLMMLWIQIPIHIGRIVQCHVGIGGWWAQGFRVGGSRHRAGTTCCVVLLWTCSVQMRMWCPGDG